MVQLDKINPKNKEESSTSAIAVKEEESDIFIIRENNYLNLASDESLWIVDSSASFHITPHEWMFSSYRKGECSTVKIGNQVTCEIVGLGDIQLMTYTGCKLMLRDVRTVPEMPSILCLLVGSMMWGILFILVL